MCISFVDVKLSSKKSRIIARIFVFKFLFVGMTFD